MPSSNIYRANTINQHLNDYLLSMLPIQWCSEDNTWSNGSKKSWRKYMLINVFCKTCIATILTLVALYLALFYYSSLVKFHYAFSLVTLLPLIWGSFGTDMVLYLFGTDMIICCNWCYSLEDKVCTTWFKNQNSNMLHPAFEKNNETRKSVKGAYYSHFNFNLLSISIAIMVFIHKFKNIVIFRSRGFTYGAICYFLIIGYNSSCNCASFNEYRSFLFVRGFG